MKTLTIRSDTPEEDVMAAYKINQEMNSKDTKKIVWFSSIGQTVENIEKMISEYKEKLNSLEKKISMLTRSTVALDKEIQSNNTQVQLVTKAIGKMEKTMEKTNEVMERILLNLEKQEDKI